MKKQTKELFDERTKQLLDQVNASASFGDVELENKQADLGLCKVWAYHCNRCNYLWFPKDFDADCNFLEGGKNIFDLEPPEACARCKSKYWNRITQRKTKHAPEVDDIHDMYTMPRLRALHRKGFKIKGCKCQNCK